MDNTCYNFTNDSLATTPLPNIVPTGMSGFATFLIVAHGVIALVGLFGNAIVLFVIPKYLGTKAVTHMYILNLAIADTLFLLGIPMIMAMMVLRRWVFGNIMCKIYFLTTCINNFTGTFTLVIMSLDRFLAVVFPIRAMNLRTPKFVMLGIIFIWILSALLMLPVALYAQQGPNLRSNDSYSCRMEWPSRHEMTGKTILVLYTSILGFFVPVAAIVALYSILIWRLRSAQARASTQQNLQRRKKNANRKATKLVTVIIAAFVICWMPERCFQIHLIIVSQKMIPPWKVILYTILSLMSYANSAINPFIYGYTNENFQTAFRNVLCFGKWRTPNGVIENNRAIQMPMQSRTVAHHNNCLPVNFEAENQHEPTTALTTINSKSQISERDNQGINGSQTSERVNQGVD